MQAYRILNPDPNANLPNITASDPNIYAQTISDYASSSTNSLLAIVGQKPGSWTLPVCDQDGNFWMTDCAFPLSSFHVTLWDLRKSLKSVQILRICLAVRIDEETTSNSKTGSGTGGYNISNPWYEPAPCACGYQGSGTARFFQTLGMSYNKGSLYWIMEICDVLLNSVDPMLPLKTENIG